VHRPGAEFHWEGESRLRRIDLNNGTVMDLLTLSRAPNCSVAWPAERRLSVSADGRTLAVLFDDVIRFHDAR
jgi:hypothetical protein